MAITAIPTLTDVEKLAKRLRKEIESDRAEIDRFSQRLLQEPGYAMEWAHSQFLYAARIEINRSLLTRIEGGADVQSICNILLDNVLRSNTVPASSSPTSNLMDQHRRKVILDLLSLLTEA